MASAQERAKALAQALKQAVLETKAAEAKVKRLSEELTQTLAEAKAEAEVARTIVEYPSGRYECASCGFGTMFLEATRELPACDNCGNRRYRGHEPKVIKVQPPVPKKYAAGMYECTKCQSRNAILSDTDELPPCELCGRSALASLN